MTQVLEEPYLAHQLQHDHLELQQSKLLYISSETSLEGSQ